MNNSFFTGQVQSVMQKLMFALIERLLNQLESKENGQTTNPTSSPTTTAASTSAPVSGDFSSLINQAAQKYGVNPGLVQAVMIAGSTVTLVLTDNEEGDTDPTLGVIQDPSGPVFSTSPIPTLSAWGMLAMSMLLLGSAMMVSRRKVIASRHHSRR